MITKVIQHRIFRFIVGGGVAATFNLLLMFLLIHEMDFSTPFLRNVANLISIELSLLLSFFIYRIWVWNGGSWVVKDVLFRQLPLYHISASAAVFVRIFIVFPVLDWLGVNYVINTLIGVVLSATLNYLISDKLVFKTQSKQPKNEKNQGNYESEIYYPEGLEPGLADTGSKKPLIINKQFLLSLVIPAYNEEGGILSTVDSICKLLDKKEVNYEILVINDNSKDRTEELLQTLTQENDRVRYINNYYPNGFGFAVRCGLENFQGDAVAIVMADSSDAPENIVDYYYKLQQGYDCVFGSRFIKGGKVIDYPQHKLIINRLANLFVKILFGLDYNDTTNAFKMYRREVIDGVNPLISHHFNLTVEIPLKAIIRGYTYAIVPIAWSNRKTGVSKLKIKEMGSRYLFIVLSILLEKLLSRGDYIRKHNHSYSQLKN
ncbi:glycosyltransferase [Nodularia harveyana UHCC-0300]|uniref:Glycosyltransferase n=1 Tax=Nodularia harveyana UHCC-0300 TaxID=2974287 RepID=A0ABU5UCK9_9CYAN|nr:glycosyltransferase [Nodularia harveyana]MEA5581269.1 glycosyltransferase [Nodularia harveyana UHCC-0300]